MKALSKLNLLIVATHYSIKCPDYTTVSENSLLKAHHSITQLPLAQMPRTLVSCSLKSFISFEGRQAVRIFLTLVPAARTSSALINVMSSGIKVHYLLLVFDEYFSVGCQPGMNCLHFVLGLPLVFPIRDSYNLRHMFWFPLVIVRLPPLYVYIESFLWTAV